MTGNKTPGVLPVFRSAAAGDVESSGLPSDLAGGNGVHCSKQQWL